MIIGITGTNGSGKSTLIDFLKRDGFRYYSHSDEIRDELRKSGVEENRINLINTGNDLRKRFGAGVLAARISKKIQDELRDGAASDFVIDSIRNPEEVAELRKLNNFIFIAVDAPVEQRFERVMKRQARGERNESTTDFEEFKKLEQLEMSSDPNAQQLHRVMKMADHIVINDGSIDDLNKKLFSLLDKTKRMNIDEY